MKLLPMGGADYSAPDPPDPAELADALREVALALVKTANVLDPVGARVDPAAEVRARVEALAARYDESPNWREWGVPQDIRKALADPDTT